jgi:hypothetical protein
VAVLVSPDGSQNAIVTLVPGALDCTIAASDSAFGVGRSSILVTNAPLDSPAAAAGLGVMTPTTVAPLVSAPLLTRAPSQPCDAVPLATSSDAMRFA